LVGLLVLSPFCPAQAPADTPAAVLTMSPGQPVSALAFSPDGRRLASASRGDPTVPAWDVATGMEVGRIAFHPRGASALAFSPDGKTLAVAAGTGTIFLRDFPGGDARRELKGHSGSVYSLTFSRDGNLLASASGDRRGRAEVRLWALGKGGPRERSGAGAAADLPLHFSADDRFLYSGSRSRGLRALDLKTGKAEEVLTDLRVTAFAVLPAGECLVSVSGEDGGHSIHFWDASSKRRLKGVKWAARAFSTVAFSPDARTVVSGGPDGVVRLWDALTGEEVLPLFAHGGTVQALAFSPDGRTLASGGQDGTVRVCDLARLFGELEAGRAEDLWAELAGRHVPQAVRAQWRLAADPEKTVRELRRRLQPPPPREEVLRLLADLDHARYAVRARATAELRKLGAGVAPALAEALKKPPSLECRRRLEGLLRDCERSEQIPENLWRFRAVAILEQVATKDARAALTRLADEGPGLLLMREARLALQRLDRRAAATPGR
jgi:hypothetical protein